MSGPVEQLEKIREALGALPERLASHLSARGRVGDETPRLPGSSLLTTALNALITWANGSALRAERPGGGTRWVKYWAEMHDSAAAARSSRGSEGPLPPSDQGAKMALRPPEDQGPRLDISHVRHPRDQSRPLLMGEAPRGDLDILRRGYKQFDKGRQGPTPPASPSAGPTPRPPASPSAGPTPRPTDWLSSSAGREWEGLEKMLRMGREHSEAQRRRFDELGGRGRVNELAGGPTPGPRSDAGPTPPAAGSGGSPGPAAAAPGGRDSKEAAEKLADAARKSEEAADKMGKAAEKLADAAQQLDETTKREQADRETVDQLPQAAGMLPQFMLGE